MKERFLESSGYIGASLILAAYFLISFNIINSHSIIYQSMNLIGSLGNLTYYFYKKAYSGTILDGIWLIIAIIALVQIIIHH